MLRFLLDALCLVRRTFAMKLRGAIRVVVLPNVIFREDDTIFRYAKTTRVGRRFIVH